MAMEDYFLMFQGSSADPNLASPPAQVNFSGNFASAGPSDVSNDGSILQESFNYLNSAENILNSALNNGSINSAQYNADQARVQQFQMYNVFMFDTYQLEYDTVYPPASYPPYDNNHIPAVNSLYFNTLLKDITTLTSWEDQLSFTGLVDDQYFLIEYDGTSLHFLPSDLEQRSQRVQWREHVGYRSSQTDERQQLPRRQPHDGPAQRFLGPTTPPHLLPVAPTSINATGISSS